MHYKQKRNLIIVAIIFLAGVFLGGRLVVNKSKPGANRHLRAVAYVIDGDTFKLKTGERVRLLSIDAPEKGECYYQESRQALKKLIEGRQVRLEKDVSEKDKYGRLLRYVILPAMPNSPYFPHYPDAPDLIVNQYLVDRGYALYVPSPPDKRYRDLIISARDRAKKGKRGLWGACKWPLEEREKELRRERNQPPPNSACIIKGNISEKGFGKIYLIPGCDNYNNVKIDPRKGERYFCTEQEAINAGFRKATNCL